MLEGMAVPPASRERQVTTEDGAWRVLTSLDRDGDVGQAGVPLLLLHGGGYDTAGASWWLAFEEHGDDRCVLAPDLPGYGGSRAVRAAGRAAATADQVVRLLDSMDAERVVVCGVSMGGEVALELAVRHPERVLAVVALAAGGLLPRLGGPLTQGAVWLSTRVPDRGMRLLGRWGGRLAGPVLRWMVHDPSVLPPEAVAEFLAEAGRPGAGAAYGIYNRASTGPRGMRGDLLAQVAELRGPAVLAHGDADPAVDVAGSRAAAAAAPRGRFVLVPRCGHWIPLERPEVVADLLRETCALVDG